MFGMMKAFSFNKIYSSTIIFSDATMPAAEFLQYATELSFKSLLRRLARCSKECFQFKSKIRRRTLYMVGAQMEKDVYTGMRKTVEALTNEG